MTAMPQRFGHFHLLERIGSGGMAEVFRARVSGAAGFERILAVKRIHPSLVGDSQFLAMFIDEAKIAVRLAHANIAQVFDLGVIDDRYYIALEHVHGRDLKAVFGALAARGQAMPIAQACHVMMQVLLGLDYAHNQTGRDGASLELVHRDVSLQNILASFDGEVKLIDFGIAKATDRSAQTQAGFVKGKFAYMSPEQLRGLPVDRRSDVFSAGIVLYELVTGTRLFYGESTLQTLKRVRDARVPPPRIIDPQIPARLEEIMMRALAKHVEQRYQSAAELYDDLEAFVRADGFVSGRRELSHWLGGLYPGKAAAEVARLTALSRAASAIEEAVGAADGRAEPGAESSLEIEIDFVDPDDSLVTTMPFERVSPAPLPPVAPAPPMWAPAPPMRTPAPPMRTIDGTLIGWTPSR